MVAGGRRDGTDGGWHRVAGVDGTDGGGGRHGWWMAQMV